MPANDGRRTRLLNMLLLCCSLLVGIVFVEVAMRIAGVAYPVLTKVDPDLGFALRPGAEGWQRQEGEAYIKINAHGQRDSEHEIRKPPGTFRIAVLGDSYTEARQVDAADRFTSVLERELAACPPLSSRQIEVMNFGVSGYGTGQQYTQLKRDVLQYDPDVVLLAFFPGNDVVNNSAELTGSRDIPFYSLEQGTLVLDTSFRDTAFYRFQNTFASRVLGEALNRSRVLQLLNRARHALRTRAIVAEEKKTDATATLSVAGLDYATYGPPATEQWTTAWNVTDALLRAMHDESAAHGARFMTAVLGSDIELQPDPAIRADALRALDAADFSYPLSRISGVGALHGFPVIDTADDMRRYAEEYDASFTQHPNGTEGHWNVLGHSLAGTIIADGVCKALQ